MKIPDVKILRGVGFETKGFLSKRGDCVVASDVGFRPLAYYDGHRTFDSNGRTLAYEDITKVIAWNEGSRKR